MAGKILIDDNDINNYSFDTIKKKVTITNNNYFFLNKSIKDNLTLGNDIEEDKIMEALKLSNAYDFVMAKGGLDVLVSQGATNFSGGEKERLQIARAILTDADILIFDASLSALDNITMHKTIDNLLSLKKTLIIASDRVFGLEKCDRIMVLDNNQISGFSSHDTLMKENKLYQDIYNLNKRGDNK